MKSPQRRFLPNIANHFRGSADAIDVADQPAASPMPAPIRSSRPTLHYNLKRRLRIPDRTERDRYRQYEA